MNKIFIPVYVFTLLATAHDSVAASDSGGMDRILNDAKSFLSASIFINSGRQKQRSHPPIQQHKSSPDHSDIIVSASYRYQTPTSLISAVIKCESNWKPRSLSKAGARGLMQIMPRTAKSEFQVSPASLWDPVINIHLGTAYLRLLSDRYRGNSATAVAAYNAGPGRVESSVHLPEETRLYKRCVHRWIGIYSKGTQ